MSVSYKCSAYRPNSLESQTIFLFIFSAIIWWVFLPTFIFYIRKMEIDRSNFFGHMHVMSIFVILRPTHFVLTHAFIEYFQSNKCHVRWPSNTNWHIFWFVWRIVCRSTNTRSCFFGIFFNFFLNVTWLNKRMRKNEKFTISRRSSWEVE